MGPLRWHIPKFRRILPKIAPKSHVKILGQKIWKVLKVFFCTDFDIFWAPGIWAPWYTWIMHTIQFLGNFFSVGGPPGILFSNPKISNPKPQTPDPKPQKFFDQPPTRKYQHIFPILKLFFQNLKSQTPNLSPQILWGLNSHFCFAHARVFESKKARWSLKPPKLTLSSPKF